MTDTITAALAEVGPRLRRLRNQRGVTLVELSSATGISKSTLSRLESGQRRPSLELLLPISVAHQVPLDELVGAPMVGDPRVRLIPRRQGDRVAVPLTGHPGGLQAHKLVFPPGRPVEPRTHEGYAWFYVLCGRARLVLADHDITMSPGEAAEFDCHVPHWFGSADDKPVEILSLFGKQGEKMHVRARPARVP
jgi:transcriptional regulator with XRE-family HTH domain